MKQSHSLHSQKFSPTCLETISALDKDTAIHTEGQQTSEDGHPTTLPRLRHVPGLVGDRTSHPSPGPAQFPGMAGSATIQSQQQKYLPGSHFLTQIPTHISAVRTAPLSPTTRLGTLSPQPADVAAPWRLTVSSVGTARPARRPHGPGRLCTCSVFLAMRLPMVLLKKLASRGLRGGSRPRKSYRRSSRASSPPRRSLICGTSHVSSSQAVFGYLEGTTPVTGSEIRPLQPRDTTSTTCHRGSRPTGESKHWQASEQNRSALSL